MGREGWNILLWNLSMAKFAELGARSVFMVVEEAR